MNRTLSGEAWGIQDPLILRGIANAAGLVKRVVQDDNADGHEMTAMIEVVESALGISTNENSSALDVIATDTLEIFLRVLRDAEGDSLDSPEWDFKGSSQGPEPFYSKQDATRDMLRAHDASKKGGFFTDVHNKQVNE